MRQTESVLQVLGELDRSHGALKYVILGGNAGDALIDLGFFALVDTHRIDYEIVSLEEVPENCNVVISGGGGLVTEWSELGTRAAIESLHKTANHLVVLPSTIRGHQDLLERLGRNVTIFARERASLTHLNAHLTGGAKALIDHDMAFNLDARAFIETVRPRHPTLRTARDCIRYAVYGLATVRSHAFNHVSVRRRDGERTGSRPWRLYNDLSSVTAFRGKDKTTVENTGRMFLGLIDRYDSVSTDRLHVGIAAYLLGKSVELLDNSNSKIHGVYEYSLAASRNVWLGDA